MLVRGWMPILPFLHSGTDQKEAESTTLHAASTAKRTCPSTSTRTVVDRGSGGWNKYIYIYIYEEKRQNAFYFFVLAFCFLSCSIQESFCPVAAWWWLQQERRMSYIMLYPSANKGQSSSTNSPSHTDVSKNRGTPKSSILIGFSIRKPMFVSCFCNGSVHIGHPRTHPRTRQWKHQARSPESVGAVWIKQSFSHCSLPSLQLSMKRLRKR